MEGKGETRAKGPATVEGVNAPENTSGQLAGTCVSEVVHQALLTVEAHLEGSTSSSANGPPGQQLLVTVKVVDALVVVHRAVSNLKALVHGA